MASARVYGERVMDSWDRLVRATLRRENARHSGGPRPSSSGIAGSVPPPLTRSTNIDMILWDADDPTVSRILCEQAYRMAQNSDPSSDGRGFLQFKTGLMSFIKIKPLVSPTSIIRNLPALQYSWHDLVSKLYWGGCLGFLVMYPNNIFIWNKYSCTYPKRG